MSNIMESDDSVIIVQHKPIMRLDYVEVNVYDSPTEPSVVFQERYDKTDKKDKADDKS